MARDTAFGNSYGLASESLVIMSSMTARSAADGSRCIPSKRDWLRFSPNSSSLFDERLRGVAVAVYDVLLVIARVLICNAGDDGANAKAVERVARRKRSLMLVIDIVLSLVQ